MRGVRRVPAKTSFCECPGRYYGSAVERECLSRDCYTVENGTPQKIHEEEEEATTQTATSAALSVRHSERGGAC